MGSLQDFVGDAVDRSVALGDGTAVIDAGSGIVQWLSSAQGVFDIEVVLPNRESHRSWRQRLRGRMRTEPESALTERQLAVIGSAGFVDSGAGYVLRADEAGLDRDHVVHVVVTMLHDVLEAQDDSNLSVEIF
ncbi:hypothetical protein BJY24_002923 [Nocardia transvalensis]|uniref:Uncharacterized protein n=1 Tax=Nocardia transvalensis TaxID=37333 RepID=A0A7W9UIA5_9NOCA|nr:hypothetical protein [Nocardia transvalensis]MBB5914056.1 hypothetical protein [Nocardia transvalensis]